MNPVESSPGPSAVSTIESFLNLKEGWNFGEGHPATEEAVKIAKQIDSFFLDAGADQVSAFPRLDGGIMVCGYKENENIEVEVTPDGQEFVLFHEAGNDLFEPSKKPTFDEIRQYIKDLPWDSKSSDCFTFNTTILNLDDLEAQLFRNQRTVQVFLYSVQNVPETPIIANAITYSIAIPLNQPDQFRSFGELTPMTFPNKPRLITHPAKRISAT